MLSFKRKVGYGLGDTASNIVFQTVANFMLIFYTDVFGISAAAAGTLMLVVRLFDGFTDPVMGGITDRTRTKWGVYRPYLLFLAVPYALLAVLAFTTPDFSESNKLIYAYITYAVLMTAYTAINIPYSALGGVMTSDPKDRASLQSYRFAMAMAGAAVVVWAVPELVIKLGQGDEALGYQLTMAFLAMIALICFVACFYLTEEKIQTKVSSDESMFSDFISLFKNDQWLIIAAITVLLLSLVGMRSAVTPHYVKYYMGDESLTSSFLLLATLASFIGALSVSFFSKIAEKRTLLFISALGTALFNTLLFALPGDLTALIFSCNMAASFCQMIMVPIIFSMVADTVDHGTLKTGKRIMGMTFSGHLLMVKLGFALGGAGAGWILSAYHYMPNQAQSTEGLNGIILAFAILPIVFSGLCAVLSLFYKLDNNRITTIQKTLNQQQNLVKQPRFSHHE
ncbi:MFS transporter [Algibacillus agarilyticus]|uniref:MFS transporter n=1 Tax=Algibacillus agarilyticus TaxID=2234133 RepID=UPI000DD025C1|nr:MFS transporter [Algibacillus agarilyticus]